MKNIVYKLKYLVIAVLALSVSSCDALLDDEVKDFGSGPNFVGFSSSAVTLSAPANGDEYERTITVSIIGPTVENMTEPVTVNIGVDPSSTAVEGVHYRLETTSVTLTPENDYRATIPVTIITEDIFPPLDTNPVLVLNITETSNSGANLVINDKTESVNVTLSYLCSSELEVPFTWTASGPQLSRTLSGSDALVRVEGSDTRYKFESGFFDFGYYCLRYNGGEDPGCGDGAAGSLELDDTCGKLSYAGTDQYGDSWVISDVVVNGPDLTFTWLSDWGESSRVTLTRTDGEDWPANLRS